MSAVLYAALDAAAARLKEVQGGQLSTRQGVENKYGEAYQALVKAGLRPQLRGKYRR